MGRSIRVAIAGVGNCASSLVQGVAWYRRRLRKDGVRERPGLMHYDLGGYLPGDIQFVCAFDIDKRKVGRPLEKAVFAPPNCTKVFERRLGTQRRHRPDGAGPRRLLGPHGRVPAGSPRFVPARARAGGRGRGPAPVAGRNPRQLPAGRVAAGRRALRRGVPGGRRRASSTACRSSSPATPAWGRRFARAGLPCVGDDIKAQIGATIVHRTLARLFRDRGVALDATYQLNTGGNTDFLNMLKRDRLRSKKVSKTEAVQSQLEHPLPEDQIHIGPSDYVPWQKDNKVCFLRMEGRTFGGVPMNLELRLSVEDSPNSAGCGIDAIRLCRLARDRKLAGPHRQRLGVPDEASAPADGRHGGPRGRRGLHRRQEQPMRPRTWRPRCRWHGRARLSTRVDYQPCDDP